jgi:hypothetical protein
MAKYGDGWLSTKMGSQVGRWVANEGDGRLSREIGGSVGSTPTWVRQRSGFESRHLSKIQNG